jgi:hypothetical protein
VSLRSEWRDRIREDPDLSSAAKLVGWTLTAHMDEDGGSCFPGLRLLERETNYTRTTIVEATRELERRAGLLVDRGGGRTHPNHYRVTVESVDRYRSTQSTANGLVSGPEYVREDDKGGRHTGAGPGTDESSPGPAENNGNKPVMDGYVEESLRALVASLTDADARTLDVFARDFAWLGADAIWYALDEVEKRRESGSAGEPIESEAGYARGILNNVEAGRSFPRAWRD